MSVVVVAVVVVLDLANNSLNSRNSKPAAQKNMHVCFFTCSIFQCKNKKFLHPVAQLVFNKCMNFNFQQGGIVIVFQTFS